MCILRNKDIDKPFEPKLDDKTMCVPKYFPKYFEELVLP